MTQPTPIDTETLVLPAQAAHTDRFIYIAVPWSPAGGGMYKVADYLIQAQAPDTPEHAAQLRPLDTRGPGKAWTSFISLGKALWQIARGKLSGGLAGVHVNMAERLSMVRKGLIVTTCFVLRVPVVIHLHAQTKTFYRSLPLFAQDVVRWMFSLASTVIVIGSGPRKFVVEELGVNPKKVDIVINGVPGPAQAPERRIAADGIRRALFVGRLCEPKGVSDLLQALALAPLDREKVEVTLAGNGDIARYETMANALGISSFVKFAGWCDQEKVDELLAKSDLLVLPSHDEVLPLVVLEALGRGVAVVCTPVGELPTVLTDGENACFVPVGDAGKLAETLGTVLNDDERLLRLGRAGRRLYEQQFSLQRFFTSVSRVHQRHFGISGHLPQAQELAE
ncbi:glycosyltransferase family 4 protein [Ramlibacter sp. PS4R-6]|uniref:glycosyltransferase family 4 protein n=1 Tax=Ramlibacter sp. PS4R-6 TaxID=3133438 RepID=UPI0030B142A8